MTGPMVQLAMGALCGPTSLFPATVTPATASRLEQGEEPRDVLIGVTIPLGSLLHFRTLENIPILVLVVIGVLAFRCLNTDDKPASAEGSLAVAVLVGFPRFIRKGTDQGGEEDQPLVVVSASDRTPVGR